MNLTKSGKISRIQHCSDCGKRFPNIHGEDVFMATPKPEDWIWMDCDTPTCGELICEECSDVDEKTGLRYCTNCLLQQDIDKRIKEREERCIE